jgi:predicted secreted hydrolase
MHRILCLLVLLASIVFAACEPDRATTGNSSGPTLSGIRYLAGGDDASGFEQATAPGNYFSFPADHDAHSGFRTEWWYFTGNVFDAEEQHYGFELTFFRVALKPNQAIRESAFATNEIWMAHVAVTDTAGRRFQAAERLSRGAAGLAGTTSVDPRGVEPLIVAVEDFNARFAGNTVTLAASDADFGLELELTGLERIVAQGNNGLDAKGPEPGNASYYFSAPRLAVNGTIQSAGERVAVEGSAWMDREWSTSALSPDIVGWDWFALQLDDGRDLMFYRLRRVDGGTSEFSGGSLTSASGSVRRLEADSAVLQSTRTWTSDSSGIDYPVAWTMAIPSADLSLAIEPRLDRQEIDLTVRYWEGAVTVEGLSAGTPVGGHGYLELAGY